MRPEGGATWTRSSMAQMPSASVSLTKVSSDMWPWWTVTPGVSSSRVMAK